jgi:hypothetical protein
VSASRTIFHTVTHEWDRHLAIVASLEGLCLAYALLIFVIRFTSSLATETREGYSMDNTVLIVLIAIAVIAIVAGIWFYYQRNSSKRLKERFGPEYDRTVNRLNNRDVAEKELRNREARVTRFKIVPLSREDSQRYHDKWTGVQAQFVDEPKVAVSEANFLIQEVMTKRGYPVTDFEQSAADLSVEHPVVVENYRVACEIAERNKRGAADTEELRRAFVSYRALFEDLVDANLSDGGTRQPEALRPSFGKKSNNRKGMHP